MGNMQCRFTKEAGYHVIATTGLEAGVCVLQVCPGIKMALLCGPCTLPSLMTAAPLHCLYARVVHGAPRSVRTRLAVCLAHGCAGAAPRPSATGRKALWRAISARRPSGAAPSAAGIRRSMSEVGSVRCSTSSTCVHSWGAGAGRQV